MGFFDSITKSLFGGSDSKSKQSSQSGFALLPPELQNAFTQYGSQLTSKFGNGGYSVLPQTEDETNALNMVRQGMAPTAESIQSDVSMLMNPFDEFVINDINREATGQNSLVNQAATQAGQQGSNRSFLASSDVEQNRLNNIGQFRQGQYNSAIDSILGPLAQLRQQDVGNLLGAGTFQRGLQQQQQLGPLQAYGTLLGAIPQSGGSTASGSSSSSSQNGIFGSIPLF